MNREDRFVMSHKQYAVDLSSLSIEQTIGYHNQLFISGRINAVWFRRRRGVTVACIGYLWGSQDSVPEDGRQYLERHTDGRYGGHTEGRWDGTGYWGAEEPVVAAEHLEVLRPMLASYEQDPKNPQAPAGYDGWWTFR